MYEETISSFSSCENDFTIFYSCTRGVVLCACAYKYRNIYVSVLPCHSADEQLSIWFSGRIQVTCSTEHPAACRWVSCERQALWEALFLPWPPAGRNGYVRMRAQTCGSLLFLWPPAGCENKDSGVWSVIFSMTSCGCMYEWTWALWGVIYHHCEGLYTVCEDLLHVKSEWVINIRTCIHT
jgi:hypothetical protein